MAEWISVEDKLPDHDGYYIVGNNKDDRLRTIRAYYMNYFQSFKLSDDNIDFPLSVTHWFEIPMMPKKELI